MLKETNTITTGRGPKKGARETPLELTKGNTGPTNRKLGLGITPATVHEKVEQRPGSRGVEKKVGTSRGDPGLRTKRETNHQPPGKYVGGKKGRGGRWR